MDQRNIPSENLPAPELSPHVVAVGQEMADIFAGRRVPERMWIADRGCTTAMSCVFLPLNRDEGQKARYFTREGDQVGTIYFRPQTSRLEELYFRDPINPAITTTSQFVPVNQGAITVGVRPRSDVWFWLGRGRQQEVDRVVQLREWVLPESIKGPHARPPEAGPVTRAARKLFAPLLKLLHRPESPKAGPKVGN